MKTKRQKTQRSLKQNIHKLVLPAILFIQFVIIGILAFYVHFTYQELKVFSTVPIGNLIISAVDGLVKDINIDPQTGNVYIHEARLVLPPPPDFYSDLLYRYDKIDELNQEVEVRIINKAFVNRAKSKIYGSRSIEQTFAEVPQLQSCARGYLIVFSERKDTDIPKVFQKQLKDGRTVYVYLEGQCFDSEDKDSMIPYLKQVESY